MPASAGAIRQGRAFVELFTDDTKLQQGLRKAENALKKFGRSVSQVGSKMMLGGAAILAPLGLAVKSYASAGEELKEMADRTGVAVEALSALKYAASQTGASMEDLEKGIKMSQKVMGSTAGAKALAELGIDAAKLKALSPEEAFLTLAEVISRIPNQADRAAAAMKIFGRAGVSLLPFIKGGRNGIEELMAQAKKLGLIMSTEDAEAAHTLSNSMSRVHQQVMKVVESVGAALAPALEQFGQWLSKIIPQVRAWVDENRGLIVAIAKGALYLVGFGAALWAIGKACAVAATIIATLRVVVAAVTIKTFLWIAGIAAAVAALLYFTGGLSELGSVFKTTWGGISDAMAAGDLALAMQIVWAGIRVVWAEGIDWLLDFFHSFWTVLLEAVYTMSGGLLIGWEYLCQGLHWAWTELWTRVRNGWTESRGWLLKEWAKLRGIFDKGINVEAEIKKIDDETAATIKGRQDVRAQEHAADQRDTDDTIKAVQDKLRAIQDANTAYMNDHAAEVDKLKAQLADLIAKAHAEKEAMKNGANTPDKKPVDISGVMLDTDDKTAGVAGAFDVGALLSVQAGGENETMKRIAHATERTAEATEAMSKSNDDDGYGA